MFNVVSRFINQTSIGQNKQRKYDYAIDFKMACMIIRKYFRNNLEFSKIQGELIQYVVPIRPDRKDKRKVVKPKTAVWFVYRVA